jgi:hypothetical protein
LAVLIADDSITTGGGSSGPPRPDRRVWRDYVGNWWWPRPWHAVAAQMAVWVGWTTQETMRQPLGVLGRVYAAHARDDD